MTPDVTTPIAEEPHLRFRSAYRRAAEAPTAAAALDMALATERLRERGRMLLAIARRADLDETTLNRMVDEDRVIGGAAQWVHALLQDNPTVAATPAGRQYINRDTLPGLVATRPPGMDDVVLREVIGLGISDPLAAELSAVARTVYGPEAIDRVVTAMLDEEKGRHQVAASLFLDDAGWKRLLATLPSSQRAANAAHRTGWNLQHLIGTLSSRHDLTEAYAQRLVKAMGTGWQGETMLRTMLRNPRCPESVFVTAASGRSEHLADAALTAEACPDAARFAAARAGRLYALIKTWRATVPVDLAHQAIDALRAEEAAGTVAGEPAGAGDRAERDNAKARRTMDPDMWGGWDDGGDDTDGDLDRRNRDKIIEAIAEHSVDHGVLHRCLEWFTDRNGGDRAAGAAALAATGGRNDNYHPWGGVERFDEVMDFLAAHPWPQCRVLVVPHLHADDLAAAATDPDVMVRLAVVDHPDAATVAHLIANDPDPAVREKATERALAALGN